MLSPKHQMLQRTVKRLLRRGALQPLLRVMEKTRAADLAFLLPSFSEAERVQLLQVCHNDDVRAQVLAATASEVAADILLRLPTQRGVELLHRLEPDDVSDILEHLDPDVASDLLKRMQWEDRTAVEDLSSYDSSTAGGIMSPRFFALNRETTVAEAIGQLQCVSDDLEMVFYVYVVNELNQLLGVVSLRQLVTTKADAKLFEIMSSDLITVQPDEDQEDVAKLASRYGLLAVPVVDQGNKLLGIVTVDDVIDVLHEEATEDILRMAGAGKEVPAKATVWRSIAQRAPWIGAVALGGGAGGCLFARLAGGLQQLAALAYVVPLLLGLSGIIGVQGAAVVAQSQLQGRLGAKLIGQVVHQILIGLLFAIGVGAICGVIVWAWGHSSSAMPEIARVGLAPALAVSLVAGVVSAAAAGALLPPLMATVRLDPVLAAGPIGAVAVELLALVVYLAVARLWLGRLA